MLSQGHVGAPLYCYTGQVVPRFGIQVHLWSKNDVITEWLRLISTSDHQGLKKVQLASYK